MRPIELEVEGFGPYATKQVIHFDDLDRVFLISGDTGAGKTSLFDAISYALYERPLGTRGKDQVRSTLVGETDPTRVRFRFACGGKTWEVVRAPHQYRKRLRGEGYLNEPVLELCELLPDGSRRNLALKPAAINAMIEGEILRLDHDKFSKILVLPQGEFQRFLEMSSDDRGAILQRLFPTEEHRALAVRAQEAAASIKTQVKTLEAQRDLLARSYDPEAFPADEARILEQFEAAGVEEGRLLAEAARHRAAEVEGKALARLLQEQAALEVRRQALEAEAPEVEALRAAVEASGRAARAWPDVQRAATLAQDRDQAAERLAAARRDLAAVRRDQEALQPRWAALPEQEERLREEDRQVERLADRLRVLDDLERARAEVRRVESRVAPAEAGVVTARQALEQAEAAQADLARVAEARVALRPRLDVARERVASLARHEADVGQVEAWTTRHAPDLARRLAEATAQDQETEAAVSTAEAALLQARARLEDQAAVLLAAGLVAGSPCPVCGSTAHPAPARGATGDDDVRQRVKAAEATLAHAQKARQLAGRAREATESEQRTRLEAVQGSRDRLSAAGFPEVAAWREARTRAAAEMEDLDRQDRALARTEATRPQREAAAVQARQALDAAQTEVGKVREAVAAAIGARSAAEERAGQVPDVPEARRALQAERDTLVARIRNERAAADALRTRWQALAERTAALGTQVQEGERQLQDLEVRLGAARVERDATLAVNGFATADEVRHARLTPEEERRRQDRVAAWVASREQVRTRREEVAAQVAGRAPPDLEALAEAVRAAEEAARELASRRSDIRHRLDDLRGRKRTFDEVDQAWTALLARSRGLLELAADLNGDNSRRLDFSTWVLTAWLVRVLEHASARLRVLSEGRYTFVLRPEPEDRRRRAGLDVDVWDAYAADRRDVKTLSGGEKFMASLALALALADVIQERAGGIELDTLFIDEGFGSLDTAALDRALQVVEEIGSHRRVGLISHVESMKRAIPCQVRVERSPAGSRVVVV